MTEEEIYEKYALVPMAAPLKVCATKLPYHLDAEFKKYAGEQEKWIAEVRNDWVLKPGDWRFMRFAGDTLEQVVHDVRVFVYHDEWDKEEPSLDWLWNHGFVVDEDDGSFIGGNLRVGYRRPTHVALAIRADWSCQAIIDGKKTPSIKAATAREAVERVCREYGLEMQ